MRVPKSRHAVLSQQTVGVYMTEMALLSRVRNTFPARLTSADRRCLVLTHARKPQLSLWRDSERLRRIVEPPIGQRVRITHVNRRGWLDPS